MIISHSPIIVIHQSLSSLSLMYDIPPGQFCALRPDYYQGKLQDVHRAPDSISDNKNIRASRGENASMPTDLIYLRSVRARIREEGQSRPCTMLLWRGVYAREKRNERTRGGVGGRWRLIVSYEFHIKILSFRACR